MIPKPSHPIVDGKPIDRYWYDALSRIATSSLSVAEVRAVVDGAIAGIPSADIRIFESSTIDVQGNAGAGFAVSLRPLADSGAGAGLWKFTRDSFGRVSGTQSATTDDLAEGAANLYFTDERVDDRVASLLKAGSNVTLTYDDTAGTLTIASSGSGPATLTASGAISALRMVVAEAGAGRYPDTSVAADAGRVVGMAITSASSGDPFDVLTSGEYTDAGWSWSPGPVFCGASGVLTQTVGTGWVLEVGRALSATRILIDVKTPLLRN